MDETQRLEQVIAAIERANADLGEVLRSLEPDEAARPVDGLDWNVADVTAHVLTVVRRGYRDRRRSSTVAETAELNAICLEEVIEREPKALADMLAEELPLSLGVWRKVGPHVEFPFHGGLTTTMVPAAAMVLGEFLVHGWDVAHATGRDWPPPAADWVLMIESTAPLAGGWMNREAASAVDELWEIELTDVGRTLRMHVDHGRIVRDATREPDHRIAMPVRDWVLTFPFRRLPTDDPAVERLYALYPSA